MSTLKIAMLVYCPNHKDKGIKAMTIANLETLLERTTGDFEVRVLFNGGVTFPLPAHERLRVAALTSRVSIAAGYNMLFRHSREKYLACVHNDVMVESNWNGPLERICDVGDVAFPAIEEDAQEQANRGISPLPENFPQGCCWMMPRALYDSLRGFDERFEGCHFEDTDFWIRASEIAALRRSNDSQVFHGRGKTRTRLADECNAAFKRNRGLYVQKHGSRNHAPLPVLVLENENGEEHGLGGRTGRTTGHKQA